MATTNLEAFDPEVAHRLRDQAKTIVEQLLRRRNQPRGGDVYFPRGTTGFALIHSMVTDHDRDLLVALLDEAAQELTREEHGPTWRICICDPIVAASGKKLVTVILHPDGAQTTDLAEVPEGLRIFCIENTPPFRIWETTPNTPKQIAYMRNPARIELADRRQRWDSDKDKITTALITRVQAEFVSRQDTLPPRVVDAIKELLARAVGSQDLLLALQAYSYLGLTPKLLTVLAPQPPTE